MAVTHIEPVTRVGIYARISADDQRDELGVKRQERNARALAEAKGWTVADVFVDNDRSASKEVTNRPEFDRLLTAVRNRQIDVVLVQNQERLVRKPDELELVIRTLRRAGHSSLWTVTAGEVRVDNTNGRTLARVTGVMSIAYSEYISEKVKEKKLELAQRGKPAGGGGRPFGFDDDKITVRKDEAKLLRDAARRLLKGESLNAIVRDWNAHLVPTVSGTKWTAPVLRGILVAPRVAGLRSYHGEVIGDAVWKPILARDEWEKIVALFDARKGRPREITTRRLLTGLLTCGRCGQPLWASWNNGKACYACVRREGRDGCWLSMESLQLEEVITEAVLLRLDKAKLPAPAAKRRAPTNEVEKLEQERDELAAMKARGDLSMSEWQVLRSGVVERLEAAKVVAGRDRAAEARAEILQQYAKGGAARRAWPKLDDAQRREVIGALVETIVIAPAVRGRNKFDPERIDVRWRA